MGGNSSINTVCDNSVGFRKHQLEADAVASILKFKKLAFELSPPKDTLKYLLLSKTSRVSLSLFLQSTECDNFFQSKNSGVCSMIHQSKVKPEQIFIPNDIDMGQFSQLLFGDRKFSKREVISLVEGASHEPRIIKALETIPKFLSSDLFAKWCESELKHAKVLMESASISDCTLPEILPSNSDFIDGPITFTTAVLSIHESNIVGEILNNEPRSKPCSETWHTTAHEISSFNGREAEYLEDAVDRSKHHVDYLEIDRILRTGSWLFEFIAAVETLPISVTIATARRERGGFPLIYVNDQFEAMTGYNRSEVMGANCKFLQRNYFGSMRSEMDVVECISNSLHYGEPIKVALTNYRKDGSPFRILLVLKPVYDIKGEFQYVIGIQLEAARFRSEPNALRVADSLYKLLPGIVSC